MRAKRPSKKVSDGGQTHIDIAKTPRSKRKVSDSSTRSMDFTRFSGSTGSRSSYDKRGDMIILPDSIPSANVKTIDKIKRFGRIENIKRVNNKITKKINDKIKHNMNNIKNIKPIESIKKIRHIKKKDVKKIFLFFFILSFIILWTLLLFLYGPSKIVDFIGAKGGYTLAFLLAMFGGFSSLTSTSLITTVITLASGGLNPFILGAITGVGVTFGDSLFFYFGHNGREIVSERYLRRIDRFSRWLGTRYKWAVPIVAYVYAGLTPLPNDILMVSMAFANIKYKTIIIPVLLGNITLMTLVSYLAHAA